jgi:hypothetical protein
MMRSQTRFIIIGAVVIAALAAGFITTRTQPTPVGAETAAKTETAAGVTPLATTIAINSGQTFAPAPAPVSAAPTMTAQQAWSQWAQQVGSSNTTIPSDVTVRLGLFTRPLNASGPSQNELAYGYSSHGCPVLLNPRATLPPSNPCIEWTFLDANSGALIDWTWQQ